MQGKRENSSPQDTFTLKNECDSICKKEKEEWILIRQLAVSAS